MSVSIPKQFFRLAIPLLLMFGLFMVANPTAALASHPVDAPWTGSGSGVTTVVSDGSSAPAKFTYDNNGASSGNWEFSTTAGSASAQALDWNYSGLHAFFQVRVALEAFIDDGTTITTVSLVNAGPTNCCASPSNGFNYSGTETFNVQAGDIYGFKMSGSHGDSNLLLSGTLTVGDANFYFTEAFAGSDQGHNLEDADSAFTVAAGVISNTAGATPIGVNRHSVRTIRTDYNTDDWVYTIDFDLTGTGEEIVYIGLGSGVPDSGWLGEPGNSVHFRIHSNTISGLKQIDAMVRGPGTTGSAAYDSLVTVGYLPSDGAYTARIVKSGSNLAFSIDGVTGVTNVALPSFLNNTNSRLFFGGGDPVTTFDNMVVAPLSSDSTPPVITLTGSDPATVEAGTSYADAGATALDDVDGVITGDIVTVNPVDVNTLGSYTVTYDASDDAGNDAAQVTRTVNVVDTIAPIINSISVNTDTLWAPNHKMRSIEVAVDVTDFDANVSCVVTGVSDNEGNDPADSSFTGDDLFVELRAERDARGNGRVYIVTVTCTDASDNSSDSTVEVTVAHDQGNGKAKGKNKGNDD